MKRILIVDIKKEVKSSDFLRAANFVSFDVIYSLTPLSSFLLDRINVTYKTLEELIDIPDLLNTSSKNKSKAVEILKKCDIHNGDENLGLLPLLKFSLDRFELEYMKSRRVRELSAEIVSDAPSIVSSYEEFCSNDSSLYLEGLAFKKIERVSRGKLYPILRKIRRISKIEPRLILHKIIDRFFKSKSYLAEKESIVVDSRYDWKTISGKLSRDFNIISPEEVLGKLSAKNIDVEDQMLLFKDEYFSGELLWENDFVERTYCLLEGAVREYFMLKENLRLNLPQEIISSQIKASLFVYCSSENFLLNYFFKRNNLKTVSYQHGSYAYKNEIIEFAEALVATDSLVYGVKDRDFFLSFEKPSRLHIAGNARFFSRDVTLQRNKSAVYILSSCYGNMWKNSSRFKYESPDPVLEWYRLKKIIDLFAQNTDWQLIIKPPTSTDMSLYLPIDEYILTMNYRNIRLDEFRETSPSYFGKFELLIFDYPETGLMESVACQHYNAISFLDCKYGEREILNELQQYFEIAEEESEFVELIQKALCSDSLIEPRDVGLFLERYCVSTSEDKKIELLRRILFR